MEAKYDLKLVILKQYGTQKDFAREIGRTELDVSRVIHNRANLSETEQSRWAEILKVRPEELFGSAN